MLSEINHENIHENINGTKGMSSYQFTNSLVYF